jgi:hypothetical protein
MWDFNWGIFWALVAYGALKFGVKRALGLYGARVKQKQPRHKPLQTAFRMGQHSEKEGTAGNAHVSSKGARLGLLG